MCVKYKDIYLFNLLNNYSMDMGRKVIDSDEKVETQRSKLLLTLGYNKSWIFYSYPGL